MNSLQDYARSPNPFPCFKRMQFMCSRLLLFFVCILYPFYRQRVIYWRTKLRKYQVQFPHWLVIIVENARWLLCQAGPLKHLRNNSSVRWDTSSPHLFFVTAFILCIFTVEIPILLCVIALHPIWYHPYFSRKSKPCFLLTFTRVMPIR